MNKTDFQRWREVISRGNAANDYPETHIAAIEMLAELERVAPIVEIGEAVVNAAKKIRGLEEYGTQEDLAWTIDANEDVKELLKLYLNQMHLTPAPDDKE